VYNGRVYGPCTRPNMTRAINTAVGRVHGRVQSTRPCTRTMCKARARSVRPWTTVHNGRKHGRIHGTGPCTRAVITAVFKARTRPCTQPYITRTRPCTRAVNTYRVDGRVHGRAPCTWPWSGQFLVHSRVHGPYTPCTRRVRGPYKPCYAQLATGARPKPRPMIWPRPTL